MRTRSLFVALESLREAPLREQDRRRMVAAALDAVVEARRTRAKVRLPQRARPVRVALAAALAFGCLLVTLRAVPGTLHEGETRATLAEPIDLVIEEHRLHLETRTVVRVEQANLSSVRIALERGAARFEVAKMPPRGVFAVTTELLRVEVVGTQFRVDRGTECTSVRVYEGRVRVTDRVTRAMRLLAAGEFQEICKVPAPIEPQAQATPPMETRAMHLRSRAMALEHLSPGEELVRRALIDISNDGFSEAAAMRLSQYLDDHPGGLFEEEARYHLCLVRMRQDRMQAARLLGERFLARFPTGTRAQKLRSLLEGGSSDRAPQTP